MAVCDLDQINGSDTKKASWAVGHIPGRLVGRSLIVRAGRGTMWGGTFRAI